MIEEKQTARSCKKIIGILICTYILIVAGYYWGRDAGKRIGLEYRFWVDACFHIWVWFVPVFFFRRSASESLHKTAEREKTVEMGSYRFTGWLYRHNGVLVAPICIGRCIYLNFR